MQQTQDIQTGKKRLIGTDKKYHTAPVFITPVLDEQAGVFVVGNSRYNAKKIKEGDNIEYFEVDDPKCPVKFSSYDSFPIGHTQSFDMGNPTQKFIFEVAMHSPYVAKTKAEVNPQYHRYYVEDLELDAIEELAKADRFLDAANIVKSLKGPEDRLDFARVLGVGNKRMSDNQVYAALMKSAKETPNLVMDSWNDASRKVRQFLRKVVEAGIVNMKNGNYVYGKDVIGVNEEFAVTWMKEPANNAIVTQWHSMLKNNHVPAETGN